MQDNAATNLQQAALDVRENRLSAAIENLQNILATTPDDFTANHLLGVALLKSKRYPEAIANLMKASHLNTQHAGARAHLGMAYAAAGKADRAREAYRSALEIDPAFALAQTGLEKLPPEVPKKGISSGVASTQANVTAKGADSQAPSIAPAFPGVPLQHTAKKDTVKDFTQPNAIKSKPKAKESALSNVDWADVTLLGLGALFFVAGLWLRFGAYVDGHRPYKTFGIIALVIGVSMVKAGMPGREHWRDDF